MARRVFEITQRSRKATARTGAAVREQTKARMTALYRQAMAITRAVVREADTVLDKTAEMGDVGVHALRDQLKDTLGLVGRVLAQTRARVIKGDTHYPDKVLSIFEPQTEAIRKGKAAKPTSLARWSRFRRRKAGSSRITWSARAGAGPGAVGAGADHASEALSPTAEVGGRRWGICLGRQRARGHRPGRG